jgi:hypothetical protein
MTEPVPVYHTAAPGEPPAQSHAPALLPVALSPELWLSYLGRRREALIMELRALDRALGRPQTIPERMR